MKHLAQRWFVRPLIALALMFTLGLVATATTPKASAHSLTSGSFTTVLHRVNLVAKGVTIGYGETLTDDNGNYELHGHLSAMPAGSHDKSYLTLHSGNDNYIASAFFTKAPQDVYLSETGAPFPFSPTTTTTNFYITDVKTNVSYSTGDFQHLVCGNFTTSVNKANLVAKGVIVGYGETLTDACGAYELHGHLSAIPAGSTGRSYLFLASQNDNYITSAFFTTAPQDLYLSEPNNYNPTIPATFEVTDFETNVSYATGF